jgi:hypothetical protein
MKSRTVFILIFSFLLCAPRSEAQKETQQNKAAAWFRGYGFQNLPEVVQWIRRLDTEWEKLVQDEQRAQMLRQLEKIASATATLKLQCDNTVSRLRTDAEVIPEIDALQATVADLRVQMTKLSTDLGGDVGKDGLAIASQFDTFMMTRAGILNEARQRLKANSPEDRAAAAEYLAKAAGLARDAHEALVLFINQHSAKANSRTDRGFGVSARKTRAAISSPSQLGSFSVFASAGECGIAR